MSIAYLHHKCIIQSARVGIDIPPDGCAFIKSQAAEARGVHYLVGQFTRSGIRVGGDDRATMIIPNAYQLPVDRCLTRRGTTQKHFPVFKADRLTVVDNPQQRHPDQILLNRAQHCIGWQVVGNTGSRFIHAPCQIVPTGCLYVNCVVDDWRIVNRRHIHQRGCLALLA